MPTKRTTSAKKASKQRSSAKSHAKKKPALTRGIGVVSSITYTPDLRNSFKNGVNDNGVTIKYKHQLGYHLDKLIKEIDKFNKDPQIGLIATVGGSIAYKAAEAYAASNPGCKPFISLVGGTPAAPSAQCYGGVSLQSYAADGSRVTYLAGKGYSPAQICLFYNPNSAMQAAELGNWPPGAARPVAGGINASGDNDSSTYGADFGRIPGGVTAVVISADPFFQDTMKDLIAAANGSNKYVCYPLQEYLNSGGTGPTARYATLYGPALSDAYVPANYPSAYGLLGQRAASVLQTSAPLNPLFAPAPDLIKDIT